MMPISLASKRELDASIHMGCLLFSSKTRILKVSHYTFVYWTFLKYSTQLSIHMLFSHAYFNSYVRLKSNGLIFGNNRSGLVKLYSSFCDHSVLSVPRLYPILQRLILSK